jgi:multidrug efflux pump subunit AcrB
VRLADVARVGFDGRPPDCVAYRDGTRIALVEVSVQVGSDPAQMRAALAAAAREVAALVPPGTTFEAIAEDRPWVPTAVVPAAARPELALKLATEASKGGVARWRTDAPHRIDTLADTSAIAIDILGVARADLETAADAISRAVAAVPGIAAVGIEGAADTLEPQVTLDRPRLSALGIRLEDAERVVTAARAGLAASPINRDGTPVPVRIVLDVGDDPAKLLSLTLPGGVPLSAVASIQVASTPHAILHENGVLRVTVWARPAEKLDGATLMAVRRRAETVTLPAGVRVTPAAITDADRMR